MKFFLRILPNVKETIKELKEKPGLEKRYNAVKKALGYLANNPRHQSLQTHPYTSLYGPNGEKVFEAYAENDTPAAYRIFFYYGAVRQEIVVMSITPHP